MAPNYRGRKEWGQGSTHQWTVMMTVTIRKGSRGQEQKGPPITSHLVLPSTNKIQVYLQHRPNSHGKGEEGSQSWLSSAGGQEVAPKFLCWARPQLPIASSDTLTIPIHCTKRSYLFCCDAAECHFPISKPGSRRSHRRSDAAQQTSLDEMPSLRPGK